MRHALGMALQDYTGALVLVSHDRYLLRLVADELWLVAGGRAVPFDGDLDDYAEWLRRAAAAPAAGVDARPATPERGAAALKERRRLEAERRQRRSPLRRDVARHEAEILRLTAEATALEARLASAELYTPGARAEVTELLASQADIRRRLAEVEDAWVHASERLEQLLRDD
jgi:ATP-binding cassette subfamily F protein 3